MTQQEKRRLIQVQIESTLAAKLRRESGPRWYFDFWTLRDNGPGNPRIVVHESNHATRESCSCDVLMKR